LPEGDAQRAAAERHSMNQPPCGLNSDHRSAVLETLRQVCLHRGWNLLAAHVRSSHVHVIVEGESPPEKVMNDFKAYASRALNRLDGEGPDRKRWARHGSTRWLWSDQDVREAIRYVVEEQGETMAVLFGGHTVRGRKPTRLRSRLSHTGFSFARASVALAAELRSRLGRRA
jgi:REP element-mobilizing transposase RayT